MLTTEDLKQIGEVMDERLGEVLETVEKGFTGIQVDIEGLKQKATKIEAVMVTKDYLDEKLGKVNGKINVLVDVLHKNTTITADQRGIVQAA